MINVTKTFLPPRENYIGIIEQIWKSNQIANGGQLHSKLRQELKEYLNVSNILLTTNGTLPLQIGLNALAKGGEASTIVWEKCKPVFVDINPAYLTIDETKIEAAITQKTTTILATHVFGNPCEVDAIEKIARKHNLKVIYDAAHCFGVKFRGSSIFEYGDISTCSFHATKLFHTGEGGAMFCKDKNLFEEVFYKHNFGHKGELDFHGLGINAKMSELQAGMGVAVLPFLNEIIKANEKIVKLYDISLNFQKLRKPLIRENTDWNFSYYPVIFKSEEILLKVKQALNKKGIYPRRYFYPSLNTLPYIEYSEMKISEDFVSRILCLPLYSSLSEKEVEVISTTVNESIKN